MHCNGADKKYLMRIGQKIAIFSLVKTGYVISDEVRVKLIILYLFLVMEGKEWRAFLL
jgi:hypothetical protein